jgi:Family of unknown function (DUF6496)
MPEKEVLERARRDAQEGKSPSTQAGEFVREEIEHVREGKHGAASPQQAVAIGLSKARRAGIKLPPPKQGKSSTRVRKQAMRDLAKARKGRSSRPSRGRSRGALKGLRRQRSDSVSRSEMSRFARNSARRRGPQARHKAGMAAVKTKGRKGLRTAAKKAARTRRRRAA